MNKLEELIREFCPDGVEYHELNHISNIQRGSRITKKELTKDGRYPVMSGGVTFFGKYTKYNRNANTITVAQYGSAGYVSFITEKFWANDICYSVFPNSNVNNKFLFYVLSSKQEDLYNLTTKAIPNCLPIDRLNSIQIPLPPMPIQQAIVDILDSFTELSTELTTELTTRKKQYEYYRELLLDPERSPVMQEMCPEGVKHYSIGDLISRVSEKGKKNPSVTTVYSVSNSMGIVPAEKIHDRQLHSEDTSNYTVIENNMFAYNPSRLNVGSIACLKDQQSGLVSPMYVVFKVSPNTNPKYLEHYLRSSYVMQKINTLKEEGARFRFDYSRWSLIDIPLPPLPVQERIVTILDNLDALCNDITTGLPAEIAARQKQYEFYRDQLLDFKAAA